ncbi:UNVERIFIED_CONTAM: acetylornithine deacetylase/succinyl-diaminopimelate desuccinylase family protein [Brevibacillus sp. OAP136]
MERKDWKGIVENWVNRNQQHIVELLQEMIRYKSVNPQFIDNPSESENDKLQDFLEDYLLSMGLDVDKWDVYEGQPNIVATVKGKSRDNTLILNGHVDVVPAGALNRWSFDPWGGAIQDGKLYGRGSMDMKAGVTSNIIVAKFIRDFGIELDSDLDLHIVIDEESGGAGTRAVLERGYKGSGVIVTEPTNGIINPVEGGLHWARVTIEGNSAHSAWRYSHIYPGYERTGVNVIEKAMKIIQATAELEKDWGLNRRHPLLPPGANGINPGVMLAGAGMKNGIPEIITNPAIIPDHCVIEYDIKYLPYENSEEIKKEFEDAISSLAFTDSWLRENPPQVEWGLRGVNFPPVNTPIDHEIVRSIVKSQEIFGISPSYQGFVAVCDVAWYVGMNIPGVIFGPKGAQLHGPDEYVELDSLFEVIKVLIMTVLRWNGILDEDQA